MGDDQDILLFAVRIAQNLDLGWTFALFIARYVGLLMFVPGIGSGIQGLAVRLPAILVFSAVSTVAATRVPLPTGQAEILVQMMGELLVGSLLGFIPLMIVSAVQLAAQLASTTMGLNASNLIDPTFGTATSDLSRITGDLTIIMFLLLGGHEVIIQAASSITLGVPVGTMFSNASIIEIMSEQSGRIFSVGLLISSPVIVALLLTQFVMGLIARAVTTINIFLLSFPLTIGIGMFLTIMALPDILDVVYTEMHRVDDAIDVIRTILQQAGK